jgi:sec-independent protein translocase protein TatA
LPSTGGKPILEVANTAPEGGVPPPAGSGAPREVRILPLLGFIGGQELLVVALILLVLFGGTRIPSLMRGMGQGIREFRKELKSSPPEEEEEKKDEP